MTSLARAARIIVCTSCCAATYGIERPALLRHDGIPHPGARMCEAPPVHYQPIVRLASPPATREDLARSPPATNITKSP